MMVAEDGRSAVFHEARRDAAVLALFPPKPLPALCSAREAVRHVALMLRMSEDRMAQLRDPETGTVDSARDDGGGYLSTLGLGESALFDLLIPLGRAFVGVRSSPLGAILNPQPVQAPIAVWLDGGLALRALAPADLSEPEAAAPSVLGPDA